MTASLTAAVAAWRKQPARARRVALRIMRGEALLALVDGDPMGDENRAMFNAAFALLRAAEKPAEKVWCNDEHNGVYCSLRKRHRGQHEEWVGDGRESAWPRKPARKRRRK